MDSTEFRRKVLDSYPGDDRISWSSVLESMSPGRRDRVKALAEALRQLPLAELILESSKIRCPDPDSDSGRKRLRGSFAGSVAVSRVMSYLSALEELNKKRVAASGRVNWHIERARQTPRTELEFMARELVLVHQLSGQIEVDIHLIVICVRQIAKMMPIAARPTGHKIPATDLRILRQLDDLRDHFEHLDERLPGKSRHAELVREIDDDMGWRLEVGFQTDPEGRILLGGSVFDVDNPAIQEIDRVVRENVVRMRVSAIDEVIRYFAENQVSVPDPTVVARRPMTTLGIVLDGGLEA